MGVSKKHIGIIGMEDEIVLKFMENVSILHHFANGIFHQPFMTGLTEVYRSIA